MIRFALATTNEPGTGSRERVATLRRAGFTDAEILDIVQVTAYFAFANRIASGLGVPLESHWERGEAPNGRE